MWHDCDSNCDSASGEGGAVHQRVQKPLIFVSRPILSTGGNAFFLETVAAMQHKKGAPRGAPCANSGGVAGCFFGLVGIDAHRILAALDDILVDDDLDHVGQVGQVEHRVEQDCLDDRT